MLFGFQMFLKIPAFSIIVTTLPACALIIYGLALNRITWTT